MNNEKNYYKIGQRRALLHLLFLPLTIFVIFLIANKQYSLIVPMAYVLIVAIAQYVRLIKTERIHLKIYSRTFFDVLIQLFIAGIILALFLLLGVAL
jgi:hypothetical protein